MNLSGKALLLVPLFGLANLLSTVLGQADASRCNSERSCLLSVGRLLSGDKAKVTSDAEVLRRVECHCVIRTRMSHTHTHGCHTHTLGCRTHTHSDVCDCRRQFCFSYHFSYHRPEPLSSPESTFGVQNIIGQIPVDSK